MLLTQEKPTTDLPSTTTRRSRLVTAGFGLLTAGFAGFVGCRLAGVDSVTPLAQLMAYVPYAVPAGALLAAVAGGFRRWRAALMVLACTAVLAVVVTPRMIGGDALAAATGSRLRVMSVNLWHGEATAELMAVVRAEQPDLLSIQEITPEANARLERAGLLAILPNAALRLAPGVAGTALYGRAEFTQVRGLDRRTRFDMVRARYVHNGMAFDVVAAHPSPPIPAPGIVEAWHRELGWLPRAAPDDGVVNLLAGDFNATLDHAGLRQLIDSGYVDAADAVGGGLTPTWQAKLSPPVTIDHILVEEGLGVRAVRVHDVSASDHRAVVADLVLP